MQSPCDDDRPSIRRSLRDVSRAVSPGRFRHLVGDARAMLAAADVTAEKGSNGLAHRGGGIMWIALSSAWGHGRLVRNADGSCDLEAVRTPGEVVVLHEHHAHVEVDDLQRIVDAISKSEPGSHVPV